MNQIWFLFNSNLIKRVDWVNTLNQMVCGSWFRKESIQESRTIEREREGAWLRWLSLSRAVSRCNSSRTVHGRRNHVRWPKRCSDWPTPVLFFGHSDMFPVLFPFRVLNVSSRDFLLSRPREHGYVFAMATVGKASRSP